MPRVIIINKVLDVISALDGWPSLRVLDLSCGEGALLDCLHQKGCHVEGTHFREDDYILKRPLEILSKVPIHNNVDLTRPLPFEDEQYDVVVATEVIEHLPNHSAFLIEATRVIKKHGHLILTTPNVHRVQSRWRFALTGQHELRSARLGWDIPAGDLYTTHHNPVYFPTMHTLIYHNKMRIVRSCFAECSMSAFLFLPILPLIWITTAIEALHSIKRCRQGGINLLRWCINFNLLFSDQFIICAQKASEPSTGAYALPRGRTAVPFGQKDVDPR